MFNPPERCANRHLSGGCAPASPIHGRLGSWVLGAWSGQRLGRIPLQPNRLGHQFIHLQIVRANPVNLHPSATLSVLRGISTTMLRETTHRASCDHILLQPALNRTRLVAWKRPLEPCPAGSGCHTLHHASDDAQSTHHGRCVVVDTILPATGRRQATNGSVERTPRAFPEWLKTWSRAKTSSATLKRWT